MQKNKDMKESVRAWQEYADRQFGKQKSKSEAKGEDGILHAAATHLLPEERPHIPSSPGSVATVRTPGSIANLDRSSPAAIAPLPRSAARVTNQLASPTTPSGEEAWSPTATVTPKAGTRLRGVQPQQPREDNDTGQCVFSHVQRIVSEDEGHRSAIPSSSQTTVDEHIEPRSIFEDTMDAEDDDVPEFVSERSLKRKRGQPSKSRFEIYADHSSDGTPVKPHHVKEEPHSSPPLPAFKMTPNETMDLDDPASNGLKTPRHLRTRVSHDTDPVDTPLQLRSSSPPPTENIKNENLGDTDLPDLFVGMREPQAIASIKARAFSEPTEPTQAEDAVLRPLDPNVLSSVSEEPPTKRSRQAQAYHQDRLSFLAESGETPPPTNDHGLRLPPRAARAQVNQRLQALKNLQTPRKTSPKTPQSGSVKIKVEQMPTPPASSSRTTHTPSSSKGGRSSKSKSRVSPRDEPTPEGTIWTMGAPETRSSVRKSRVSPSKQEGRLRDKPVGELSVQDFKPNPDYNQGYSYAFSETVRKRGDRMCLPGCTNPQCCGSTFRTFAEAQAPLSSSQEEALLEDYLGDAYSNMQLTQMSSEERQELVLQARTKKMAKESGKHREAYERRRTPPGFWRVDFPTTQEQQEDRQRVTEQEKAIVQERWLDAHRRGGRWIFRDE
jgi:hypothetical protein